MMGRDELAENHGKNSFITALDSAALLMPKALTFGRFNQAVLAAVSIALSLTSATAADWYVRPGGAGSENGSDWNNAWDCGGISWSSVNGGDTIWFAGGTYSQNVHPTKSGSAGNLIYCSRVLASDPVPTSAAGWSSSFDSQVIIAPSSGAPWYYSSQSVGSYMYIDGRVDSGISLRIAQGQGDYIGAFSITSGAGHQTDITVTNCEMAGPDFTGVGIVHSSYDNCVGINTCSATTTNITIAACRLHGANELTDVCGGQNIVFDHCKFYDSVALNGSAGHQDVLEINNCGTIVLKYCDFRNWVAVGYLQNGGDHTNFMYGCIWHDPKQGNNACVFEPEGSGSGPWYVYNNTFVNIDLCVFKPAYVGNITSGSAFQNNIYWKCSMGGRPTCTVGNEYSDSSITEPNFVVGSGATPFVNYSGKDYHIVGTVAANYPRNKGISIPAVAGQTLGIDMDGNIRGADGAWDIGAYEYVSPNTREPVLSNIQCTPGTNTATITWTTDENANSIVNYGLTASYGMSVTNSSLVTSHSVTLANLAEGTYYNFQVQSIDSTNGLNLSGNQIFNTINPAIVLGLHVVLP